MVSVYMLITLWFTVIHGKNTWPVVPSIWCAWRSSVDSKFVQERILSSIGDLSGSCGWLWGGLTSGCQSASHCALSCSSQPQRVTKISWHGRLYRKFCKNFADVALPLTNLLKKSSNGMMTAKMPSTKWSRYYAQNQCWKHRIFVDHLV